VNGRIDYIISADRAPTWHQAVRAAGAEPRSVVRSITAAPLPDELAARLERPAGSPAHRIVRQSWINGMPSGWAIEWIPDDVYPDGADVALRTVESLDQVLRQMAKVEPARSWCRVSMELPPPDVAAGLEVDAGRHIWLVESVSRDARRDFPLMTSITWSRPDVVRIIVEMSNGCQK
jgi:GntR family phosphonate transport system transcriptional regulator